MRALQLHEKRERPDRIYEVAGVSNLNGHGSGIAKANPRVSGLPGRTPLETENMKMTPFCFDESLIRAIDRDGKHWFVAKDVCGALGLADVSDAVAKLDADEKQTVDFSGLNPEKSRGNPNVLIVSESGLYALALRCRDAMTPGSVAHRFRKWVTADVLPSIRETGAYGAGGFDEAKIARIAGEAAVAAVNAMLPVMIAEAVASGEFAIGKGFTAGQVVDLAKVSGASGMRGLDKFVSGRLVSAHVARGVAMREGRLGKRSARLFDPATCREWLADGGRDAIERRVAARRGQGVLPFRKPGNK
jgi:prophage antirepressor-like protein